MKSLPDVVSTTSLYPSCTFVERQIYRVTGVSSGTLRHTFSFLIRRLNGSRERSDYYRKKIATASEREYKTLKIPFPTATRCHDAVTYKNVGRSMLGWAIFYGAITLFFGGAHVPEYVPGGAK